MVMKLELLTLTIWDWVNVYMYIEGNCSAGWYCTNTSTTPRQIPCPVGNYCPEGSQPIQCPAGSFSNQEYNQQESDCGNCTAGYYCNATGLTAESGLCAPGYYCPGGQSSITPSGLDCWAGHYCEEGSASPVFCPNGTYQPNGGQSACLQCDPGFYCNIALGRVKHFILKTLLSKNYSIIQTQWTPF